MTAEQLLIGMAVLGIIIIGLMIYTWKQRDDSYIKQMEELNRRYAENQAKLIDDIDKLWPGK